MKDEREQPNKERLKSMLQRRRWAGSYLRNEDLNAEINPSRLVTRQLLHDLEEATIAFDSETGSLERLIQARWAIAMNRHKMFEGIDRKISEFMSQLTGIGGEHL